MKLRIQRIVYPSVRLNREKGIHNLREKHLRMVEYIAWQIFKKFQFSWEQVEEWALEGLNLTLAEWSKFNPARSSSQTYIYLKVYYYTHKKCVREMKRPEVSIEEFPEVFEKTEGENFLDSLLKEMGEEGRALVRIIMEAPGDLADVFWRVRGKKLGPKAQRKHLKRYLKQEENWDGNKIRRAWREVEQCL